MHEPGQRGGLIREKYNLARLRERQPGLNRARIETHLAQKLAIAFVLGVEKGRLGEEAGAPAEREHAAVVCLAYFAQPGLEGFDGGLEQRQASPFGVLFLQTQYLL